MLRVRRGVQLDDSQVLSVGGSSIARTRSSVAPSLLLRKCAHVLLVFFVLSAWPRTRGATQTLPRTHDVEQSTWVALDFVSLRQSSLLPPSLCFLPLLGIASKVNPSRLKAYFRRRSPPLSFSLTVT